MSIHSRLDRLEAGQPLIVVNMNDYEDEFNALETLPDYAEKSAGYKRLFDRMELESGETGHELVIWTGIFEPGIRWTLLLDHNRKLAQEFRTGADTTWQDAIKTAPMTHIEGIDALQDELKRRAAEHEQKIRQTKQGDTTILYTGTIAITRMDIDQL